MEIRAMAKFVRISPRKVRLVMDQVRGKQVGDALNMLSFAPQKRGTHTEKIDRFSGGKCRAKFRYGRGFALYHEDLCR